MSATGSSASTSGASGTSPSQREADLSRNAWLSPGLREPSDRVQHRLVIINVLAQVDAEPGAELRQLGAAVLEVFPDLGIQRIFAANLLSECCHERRRFRERAGIPEDSGDKTGAECAGVRLIAGVPVCTGTEGELDHGAGMFARSVLTPYFLCTIIRNDFVILR